MKRCEIDTMLAQLGGIRNRLTEEPNPNETLEELSQLMNELSDYMAYAAYAEVVMQCIDKFEEGKIEIVVIENQLTSLIRMLEVEEPEPDDGKNLRAMGDEMKAVCSEIASVIHREAKMTGEEIVRAIKRTNTPVCSDNVEQMKSAPKRAINRVRKGIRNWLMEDDE